MRQKSREAVDRSATNSRRGFITALGAAGIAGLSGCVGGSGDGGSDGTDADSGDTGTTAGGTPSPSEFTLGFSIMGLQDTWMASFARAGRWYAEDRGVEINFAAAEFDPAKQTDQGLRMVQQGVDALIFTPVDTEASAKVVDEAAKEDIPVFCSGTTSASDNVKQFVAFGNRNAARVCGERIVEKFKEERGEARGKILEVMIPQSFATGRMRSAGLHDVADKHDGVEIVGQLKTDASESDAVTKTSNFLQQNDDVDAVYGANTTSGLGSYTALEREGMLGDTIHCQIDATPRVLDHIEKGNTNWAIDQPNLYYAPLSIEYALRYLMSGKDDSVLPSVGDEVTTDDISISGGKHAGMEIWRKQVWAPAQVKDEFADSDVGYPFVQTQEVLVSQDNVDEPWHWGRIAEEAEN